MWASTLYTKQTAAYGFAEGLPLIAVICRSPSGAARQHPYPLWPFGPFPPDTGETAPCRSHGAYQRSVSKRFTPRVMSQRAVSAYKIAISARIRPRAAVAGIRTASRKK